MPTLLLKSWRDLRVRRWQTLGLLLLVATMVTAMAGASRAGHMLDNTREVHQRELALADLEICCSPTLPGLLDRVRGVEGVAAAEEAMVLSGVLHIAGADALPATVRVLPEDAPVINRLRLLEGHYPRAGEQGVVLDRSLPTVLDVKVGDTVALEIGGRREDLPVLGISVSPDYIVFPCHAEYLIPLPGTVAALGLAAASAPSFENTDLVDSLRFRFTKGSDPEALQERLLEELGISPMAVIPRADAPDYRSTAMIIRFFDIYLPAGLLVLITVALTLLVLTLQRLVRSHASQIGVLVATGHRPIHIAASYLLLPFVAGVGGALLGAVLHGFYGRFIFDSYVNGVGFAPLRDPGPGPEIIIASVGCLLLAAAVAFGLALQTARRCPLRLMRPAPGPARRFAPLAHLFAAMRQLLSLPLSIVLGFTYLSRRRWASAATIICLALNLALVVAFIYVHVTHVVETEASVGRIGLDATVHFSKPIDDADLPEVARRVGGVAEPMINANLLIEFPRTRLLYRTFCLSPDSWVRNLPLIRGRPLQDSAANELVIDQWVSDSYDIDVGDSVSIYPSYSAPESTAFQVVGVFAGASQGMLILPLEAGRTLLNLPGLATGLSVSSDLPPELLVETLRGLPHADSVQSLAIARAKVSETFAGLERVLAVAVLMAVVVAVLFLALLAALDAADRAPDLAVLRALGWRNRSMLVLCVTEVAARGWLAFLLAIPIAPWIALWLIEQLRQANRYRMDLASPPWALVAVGAACLLLVPLGALPAWRAARRMSPGAAMRILARE